MLVSQVFSQTYEDLHTCYLFLLFKVNASEATSASHPTDGAERKNRIK